MYKAVLGVAILGTLFSCTQDVKTGNNAEAKGKDTTVITKEKEADVTTSNNNGTIDTALYNQRVRENANGDTTGLWPVKNQPYPLPGAILPFKRIVVYYGNMHSK